MAVTYLYKPGSATLDSNGAASITLRPDTGQYWLPTLVHVSDRNGSPVNCALHAGSVAAGMDITTIKDSTTQGVNDTSSILSGTVVAPGEGITCQFTLGIPGDIVFVEVVGLSSDIPPALGIIPTVPGARFAGAESESANARVLLFSKSSEIVNNVTSDQSQVVNTAAIPHVGVQIVAELNNVQVTLNWYLDPDLTNLVDIDEIHVRDAFTFDQTIPVKAQFLQVEVIAQGAATATYSIIVYAMPTEAIAQPDRWTNVLVSTNTQQNINAGATFVFVPTRIIATEAHLQIVTKLATWDAQVLAVDAAGNTTLIAWLDNTITQIIHRIFLPPTPFIIQVHNGTGAAGVASVVCIAKPFYVY